MLSPTAPVSVIVNKVLLNNHLFSLIGGGPRVSALCFTMKMENNSSLPPALPPLFVPVIYHLLCNCLCINKLDNLQ